MFETGKTLILASGSPRRKGMLSDLGIEFTVCPADNDERVNANETPEQYVQRMAYEKAQAVSGRESHAWVLSADTAVSVGATILGKPESDSDAVEMLEFLSGRQHEVRTGYCLCCHEAGICVVDSELTLVQFIGFSNSVARAYVKTGEPHDKAGAYGIQGIGGCLVSRISGSYSNVVGLPLSQVVSLLQRYNIISVS